MWGINYILCSIIIWLTYVLNPYNICIWGVLNMAQEKKNNKVKVTMNIPEEMLVRIETYAEKMSINRTAAMLVLCNMALDQQEMLAVMPKVLELAKESN